MGTDSIKVTIFGNEYSLRSDVDPETTQAIAQYIDEKMTDISHSIPSRDNVKIAILAALTITGELFELRKKTEEQQQQFNAFKRKSKEISEKIDTVIV